MRIASRRHPLVQRIRAIASKRTAGDPVLLDGEHLVSEALGAGVHLDVVLTHGDRYSPLVETARRAGADVHDVTRDVLDAVSPVRTPGGIVALARWAPAGMETIFVTTGGIVLGLVDVQDPGNVGTIIRSAAALGGAAVAALDGSADPAGWKCLRGAMGSTFRLPVTRGASADAVAIARRAGMPVMATSAEGGTPLDAVDLGRPVLVLLGNEGSGLPADLVDHADVRITIPMRPGANSLNVATTAALVLWEARRR